MSKISIRYQKHRILYQSQDRIDYGTPLGFRGEDENGMDENAEPGVKRVGVES